MTGFSPYLIDDEIMTKVSSGNKFSEKHPIKYAHFDNTGMEIRYFMFNREIIFNQFDPVEVSFFK